MSKGDRRAAGLRIVGVQQVQAGQLRLRAHPAQQCVIGDLHRPAFRRIERYFDGPGFPDHLDRLRQHALRAVPFDEASLLDGIVLRGGNGVDVLPQRTGFHSGDGDPLHQGVVVGGAILVDVGVEAQRLDRSLVVGQGPDGDVAPLGLPRLQVDPDALALLPQGQVRAQGPDDVVARRDEDVGGMAHGRRLAVHRGPAQVQVALLSGVVLTAQQQHAAAAGQEEALEVCFAVHGGEQPHGAGLVQRAHLPAGLHQRGRGQRVSVLAEGGQRGFQRAFDRHHDRRIVVILAYL